MTAFVKVRNPPAEAQVSTLKELSPLLDFVLKVPSDIGRRYGIISSDVNPIHIHWIFARLFGFNNAIAHGMWVVPTTLLRVFTQADKLNIPVRTSYLQLEVSFKRPVFVGQKLNVSSSIETVNKSLQIAINSYTSEKEKPNVVTSLTFAA